MNLCMLDNFSVCRLFQIHQFFFVLLLSSLALHFLPLLNYKNSSQQLGGSILELMPADLNSSRTLQNRDKPSQLQVAFKQSKKQGRSSESADDSEACGEVSHWFCSHRPGFTLQLVFDFTIHITPVPLAIPAQPLN